jgi:hypothetical protein
VGRDACRFSLFVHLLRKYCTELHYFTSNERRPEWVISTPIGLISHVAATMTLWAYGFSPFSLNPTNRLSAQVSEHASAMTGMRLSLDNACKSIGFISC